MLPDAPRPDSEETVRLLDLAAQGDRPALDALLARHRDGVRAFVDLHLDRPLRARFDPSDVAQDTLLAAADRLADFLARRPMPFRLWLLKTAHERVLNLRRDHRAARRDVGREAAGPDASSVALADRLVAAGPTPSEAAEARELAAQVARAIDRLADDDREVLLLRQSLDLPHDEIAEVLGITPDAARQRYGRALIRLREELDRLGVTGSVP